MDQRKHARQAGFALASELLLAITLLGIGLLVGLATLRTATIAELEDYAEAFGSTNQSFNCSGIDSTEPDTASAGCLYTDDSDNGDGSTLTGSSGPGGDLTYFSSLPPSPFVTVLDENFSAGLSSSIWSDSDASAGFEIYGPGGAGVRDMNSTYDHDQNPLTPNIPIPGAIEINDDDGPVTLAAQVNLPPHLNSLEDGVLTFFAGLRNGDAGTSATVEIVNVTDSTTILAPTTITINADDDIWQHNSFNVDVSGTDAGDTIEIRFYGGGSNSANGLQLTDLNFTVQVTSDE